MSLIMTETVSKWYSMANCGVHALCYCVMRNQCMYLNLIIVGITKGRKVRLRSSAYGAI